MKVCLTGSHAEALRAPVRTCLEAAGHEAQVLVLDEDGRLSGDPEGLEVVLFGLGITEHPAATRVLLELLNRPSLKWLQGPGAGVDHPLWQGLLDRGVRLTNASGIHAEPIAQYIFTYVLHWERNVRRHQDQQARREWQIIRSDDLGAKTLGIVGYGGIGQAAGRIGRAFGMRVLGTRRTPVDDGVLDRFVPLEDLHTLLAESHYVVLAMPYDDSTRGMIGRSELAAMRDDAVLINVARGGVVDELALIETLREGRIRGATLDVVAEEPLPESSPLWSLERCVLTPHDAGYSPLGDERLGRLFVDNLGRFLRGESMVNEIRSTGLTPAE